MNSDDDYTHITDNQYLESIDRGLRVTQQRVDILVSSSKNYSLLLQTRLTHFPTLLMDSISDYIH